MMCIISKEKIEFCVEVEETWGDIFAASPIALQSRCQRVPNAPITSYGQNWPQHQSGPWKSETDRTRKNSETMIRGRYATRCVALMPGVENWATALSLMALTEHVHCHRAILPECNFVMLMLLIASTLTKSRLTASRFTSFWLPAFRLTTTRLTSSQMPTFWLTTSRLPTWNWYPPNWFPPDWFPPDWPPWSPHPIGRVYTVNLHLRTHWITSSRFAWLWTPTSSLILLNHGIQCNHQTHLIAESRFTFKLAWSQSVREYLSSLDLGLRVYTW